MRFFNVLLAVLLVLSTKLIAKQNNISKGKQLISKSDCMGCHTEKKKILGPSYIDIAAKYPSNKKNISLLADRIIKGTKGAWGEIPMNAHPTVSKADAEEMVKYILSLK